MGLGLSWQYDPCGAPFDMVPYFALNPKDALVVPFVTIFQYSCQMNI